jgi:hypothetical protein
MRNRRRIASFIQAFDSLSTYSIVKALLAHKSKLVQKGYNCKPHAVDQVPVQS